MTEKNPINITEKIGLLVRKQLAAYYTKKSVADLIAMLLCSFIDTDEPLTFFDPACGTGVLLEACFNQMNYSRQKNLNKDKYIGIELYKPAWQEVIKFFEGNNLDFQVYLGDTFIILQKYKETFSSWMKNKIIFVTNPPYTKKQRLSPKYKSALAKTLEFSKTSPTDGLGLHFFYIELVRIFIPINGYFALIVPLTISNSEHGHEIVSNFLVSLSIKFIIISEIETAFSDGSNLEEIIIIGRKQKKVSNNELVSIIRLEKSVNEKNYHKIAQDILITNRKRKSLFFSLKSVQKGKLLKNLGGSGWNEILYRSTSMNAFMTKITSHLTQFNNNPTICMKRGINLPTDFFFIPNKYYKLVEFRDDKICLKLTKRFMRKGKTLFKEIIEIPTLYLKPIIRKPEYYKETILITDDQQKDHFYLVIPKNYSFDNPHLNAYIEFGYTINVHKRSNIKHLATVWFAADKKWDFPSKNIVLLTFKWDPRYRSFIFNYCNSSAVLFSQAFWGIAIQTTNIREQVAWFNSTINMSLVFNLADVQRRIWRQLAGKRLKSLYYIPDKMLDKLNKQKKEVLVKYLKYKHNSNLIDELTCCIESIENNNDNLRVKVDEILLDLLIPECVSTGKILIDFYTEFKTELVRLTTNLQ